MKVMFLARNIEYEGPIGIMYLSAMLKPKIHRSFEEYKKSKSPTINYFYEKLLLPENLMNTRIARQVARQRTKFMHHFLIEFFKEWKGKDL